MTTENMSFSGKFKKRLKDFGPAFFIIGYVVGTSSVIPLVIVGAKYILSLYE